MPNNISKIKNNISWGNSKFKKNTGTNIIIEAIKYFAEILVQNYDLADFRGDPLYEKKLQEYKDFIK